MTTRSHKPLDLTPFMSERFVSRFWSMVQKADGEACWTWTRSRIGGGDGYGQFYLAKGKPTGAHRVSFALANGLVIPAGREIRAVPAYYGVKADLARRFGVSAKSIAAIRSGEAWRSVA